LEANDAFTLTYTGISSSTLVDTESRKKGRKRQRKTAVFATHLADIFQPHEQEREEEMLELLEPPAQQFEHTKHQTKGNKRRNGTLKYEERHLAWT